MAKQSEHIENRFREAAENMSVPPNPLAWDKMEQLLDDENRRRPVVFWWYLLFFGLLAGAAFFTYQAVKKPAPGIAIINPASKEAVTDRDRKILSTSPSAPRHNEGGKAINDSAALRNSKNKSIPAETAITLPSENATVSASGTRTNNTGGSETALIADPRSTRVNQKNYRAADSKLTKNNRETNTRDRNSGRDVISNSRTRSSDNNKQNNRGTNKNSGKADLTGLAEGSTGQTGVSDPEADKITREFKGNTIDTVATDPAKNDSVKKSVSGNDAKDSAHPAPAKDSVVTTQVKLKADNGKWKLDRGFNFSVIGELDATAIHHVSLHEFKTIYGLGLGYRVSNRFSIQTGVFVQRAIYFAGPEDYTVKAGSYLSNYKISKIDANCLFYEIPLNIRYDLLIGKGFRLYSSAGFNSYIMKDESYRYHAMGPVGYRMFDSTYTRNKSIFSSAYFSAGIEKKLTPSFSVQLEPYITLPNSGLGEGKVKLYSSGAQVSIKFQPVKSKASSGKK